MTQESIDGFLLSQKDKGASKDSLRQRKGFVTCLFCYLPQDKTLTKSRLAAWRDDMEQQGYSKQSILNYVKGINLYLDYMGWSELRFNRGRSKDIRGLTFGYLTPIEPTGEKYRKDHIWLCQCKCGNVVPLPATRLLTGNTLSCGCLKIESILASSKYIGGTHLTQSLREDTRKSDTRSGYTGVAPKGDKWIAYITYRGKRYHLGIYSQLEDAVKARARAKELVMEDALQLLEDFAALHQDDWKPDRENLPKVSSAEAPEAKETGTTVRANNQSGYPGVCMRHNKWLAYITYKGKKFNLGSFPEKEAAITARKEAERRLMVDPVAFAAG